MAENIFKEYFDKRKDEELDKLFKPWEKALNGLKELPWSILKVVFEDDKFWNETIFIGLSNYIKENKEPLIQIFDLIEFIDHKNALKSSLKNLLKNSIAESEKSEFEQDSIKWLRNWLESNENITVTSKDDIRQSILNIFLAILAILVIVGLFIAIKYMVSKKRQHDVGIYFRILSQNILNNVKYNDKTVTGGLIKSIFILVDAWVNRTEDGWYQKVLKNSYLVLKEISKLIKKVEKNEFDYSITEIDSIELEPKDFKKLKDDELNNFKNSIGENAKKIFSNIIDKSGLWKGDAMDYIIAEMIYARIKVVFVGEKATFDKREGLEIIDWTDKTSRKQHPLSKTVERINKISGEEIGDDMMQKGLSVLLKQEEKLLNKNLSELNTKNIVLNEISELFKFSQSKISKGLKEEFGKALDSSNDSITKYKKELNAIIKDFTFTDFFRLFKIDFVVTGSNITSAQPVYFNYTLTPSMSVVKAVRISSSFPILFQPIKLNHSEKVVDPKVNYANNQNLEIWSKTKEAYCQKNYSGVFIDGGLLNNFPMNAFNNKRKELNEDDFRDPKNKLDIPPNNKVFGIKLGGFELVENDETKKLNKFLKNAIKEKENREEFNGDIIGLENGEYTLKEEKAGVYFKFERTKFTFEFEEDDNYNKFVKKDTNKDGSINDSNIGIGKLLKMMFGTTLDNSQDGINSAFYDKNEQIVRLFTGKISLFDLVTKNSDLALVDLFSYTEVFKHFNMLNSLPYDWEQDVFSRLKRNEQKRKMWLRDTKNRNRLKFKSRHF